MARIVVLTSLAMIAFAANSVLARLALLPAGSDPYGYTGIRLVSGAVALVMLLLLTQRRATPIAGTWAGAAALFGYATAFSVAYIMLGAGTGALILFASVQISILAWAILKGDRPGPLEWIGILIAIAGLAYLVSPGLVAPAPLGTAVMVIAGMCWAAYTLIGRGSASPLADTAGNFVRCLPLALPLAGLALWRGLEPQATIYAIASGVLASGLGYAIWYAALPALSRTRSAIVQLTVPAIAAIGGVIFIAEPVSLQLLIASLAILGGVAFTLLNATRRGTT